MGGALPGRDQHLLRAARDSGRHAEGPGLPRRAELQPGDRQAVPARPEERQGRARRNGRVPSSSRRTTRCERGGRGYRPAAEPGKVAPVAAGCRQPLERTRPGCEEGQVARLHGRELPRGEVGRRVELRAGRRRGQARLRRVADPEHLQRWREPQHHARYVAHRMDLPATDQRYLRRTGRGRESLGRPAG